MSTHDFTDKLVIDQALIGRVITQATSIECMIDSYIAEFYTRCPDGYYQESYLAFIYDIMNDRGVSLGTKKRILLKIYKREFGKANRPNSSLFDKWLQIRNKFAHGTYITDKGILYGGEYFDVTELANEHAELQIRINAELQKFAGLRGPYFNHFPMKDKKK